MNLVMTKIGQMVKERIVKYAITPKKEWLGLENSATRNPHLNLKRLREDYLSRYPNIKRYLLDEKEETTLKIKERDQNKEKGKS